MGRYWLGKKTPSYGEEPERGPIHALAVAVIERTLVDAAGGPSVPRLREEEAKRAMQEGPNEREFSFFWWLEVAFPNPERMRRAFLNALHRGQLQGIKYKLGRHIVKSHEKDPGCIQKKEAYYAN